jgi:ribosomal protein L27
MKKFVLLCACLAWTGAALAADAAAPAAAPAAASEPKTLKERLGDKASDEQRVDNCHVPADRRGTKVRPDRCVP